VFHGISLGSAKAARLTVLMARRLKEAGIRPKAVLGSLPLGLFPFELWLAFPILEYIIGITLVIFRPLLLALASRISIHGSKIAQLHLRSNREVRLLPASVAANRFYDAQGLLTELFSLVHEGTLEVHLLHADGDWWFPVARVERIARKAAYAAGIDNFKLATNWTIIGGGHSILDDAPGEVVAVLDNSLAG